MDYMAWTFRCGSKKTPRIRLLNFGLVAVCCICGDNVPPTIFQKQKFYVGDLSPQVSESSAFRRLDYIFTLKTNCTLKYMFLLIWVILNLSVFWTCNLCFCLDITWCACAILLSWSTRSQCATWYSTGNLSSRFFSDYENRLQK